MYDAVENLKFLLEGSGRSGGCEDTAKKFPSDEFKRCCKLVVLTGPGDDISAIGLISALSSNRRRIISLPSLTTAAFAASFIGWILFSESGLHKYMIKKIKSGSRRSPIFSFKASLNCLASGEFVASFKRLTSSNRNFRNRKILYGWANYCFKNSNSVIFFAMTFLSFFFWIMVSDFSRTVIHV